MISAHFFTLLSLLSFAHFAHSAVVRQHQQERPQVLLISFDGFRWDYLNDEYKQKYNLDLKNFDKLKVTYSIYSSTGIIKVMNITKRTI